MSLLKRKINPWLFVSLVLAGILIGIGVSNLSDYLSSRESEDQAELVTEENPDIDDEAVLGDANAPITIIEFSDFRCPYCASFASETFPLIEENYINTGKIKFVHRDFPIPTHLYSKEAAQASECAEEQGKFWEMVEILYAKQDEWGKSEDIIASLTALAGELSLDEASFRECLSSENYLEEVQKDFNDGKKYGVSGTPTFFINDQKVVGAYPYDVFAQYFDALLAEL